jgi:hypothetical protein
LNSVRHEQYPSDSIYQNNLTHGVYNITQWRYWNPSRLR